MRIWLLKDGDPLPTDGENVRLLRMGLLAQELVKRGHEMVWWTSTLNHSKKEFRAGCDRDLNISNSCLIKLLHGPGYKRNISFQRIYHNRVVAKKFLQVAQRLKQPDIVLAALPTIELALAATQYGKKYRVPVLLDLRDMWPDIMVEVMPGILRPFARIVLEWQFRAAKEACQSATGLIGVTPAFLRWGLNYAQRDQNEFDAVYPLAYSDVKPDDESIKAATLFWEKYGIKSSDGCFIISFVGSVNKSFQLGVVIEAVKKMGDQVKLVIGGVGSQLEEFRKQASGCGNIFLPGWLDKPKIWALLKMSSVGIAPYIRRRDFLILITNKPAEYLSFGLPVVTSLSSGTLGDLLAEHQCGFSYPDDNACNLERILFRIKNNAVLKENMSKNARSLYEKMFVAEKVYANMCSHLENIASGNK